MEKVIEIIIRGIAVLICITVHEFFHGYSAYKLGDDTAKRAGRLTLNPIKHIDPIGTLMLFIARFGWAKPVPVNPYNFANMKKDMALTALAGPASNFVMAIGSSLFLGSIMNLNIETIRQLNELSTNHFQGVMMTFSSHFSMSQIPLILWVVYFFYSMILYNIALGLFNLLPFPPLDGSKILGGLMSDDAWFRWMNFEQKGAYLLMIIMIIGFVFKIPLLGMIIWPPLEFILDFLLKFAMN